MRKTMIMMLLASAIAVPGLAQADPGDGQNNRAAHGGWRERPAQQGAQADRGQVQRQPRPEIRADRAEVRQDRREVRQDRREIRQDQAQARQNWRAGNDQAARQNWREAQRARVEAGADRRDLRQDRRETWRDRQAIANGVANSPAEQRRDWRQDRRDDRRDWRDDRNDRRDWRDNDRRDWRNDRHDNRWTDNRDWGRRDGDWRRDWRNDRRYDWRNWRSHNRDRFRAGRYYAPRGYGYSRWSLGYRLDPWFYGRNYWISDPWEYRLPPAYGPYRWVRYFDDVMLIDVRDGQIVDIIYDFFW